jgi:demethylmenaquinone methyltransferase/2-methoxy-6-polyprenyl-1,4-benzoquinol methylase
MIRALMDARERTARPLREIFGEVAATYETANRVLTLGLDRRWRRAAARRAAREGGGRWLDVCSGTGEMAGLLARLAPARTQIIGLDFSLPMLSLARTKTMPGPVLFVLGDARRLPFPASSFDLVTISFATRNLNVSGEILADTFRELHRVLKPGGRFVNLETSQPENKVIRGLFHAYVRLVVRRVGFLISGSMPGYVYLSSSIPRFHGAKALLSILKAAGFASVSVERLLFGAAAIHISRKS